MLDMSPLPQLDPEAAIFLTNVSAFKGPLEIDLTDGVDDELEGESAIIALDRGRPAAWDQALFSMPVSSPFGAFKVHFTMALADALSDALLPGWQEEAETALPTSWRVIAAVHAVLGQTPFASLEWTYGDLKEQSGEELSVSSCVPLKLHLRGREHRFFMEVVTPPAVAELARYVPSASSEVPNDLDLLVEVELALSSVGVDLASAAALAVGDLLLPPRSDLPALFAMVSIAGIRGWSGTLSADGAFTFSDRISKEVDMDTLSDLESHADPLEHREDQREHDEDLLEDMQEEALEDVSEGANPTAVEAKIGLEDSELAELPVRLDIRLRSLSMPLSSFVDLAPGAVIDTGADLTAPVDILGNGRVIGSGSLVQLGSRIGVQIERWRGNRG